MEFKSIEELKQRLKPALESKVQDLKYKNINTVDEEGIWNYLKEIKWKNAKNLNLSDMVNDILKFNMGSDCNGE